MQFTRLASALALSALFCLSGTAHAASIVINGSLTGSTVNMGTPDGWSILEGTPDTLDGGNNVGVTGATDFGVAPTASPDGGTWVGLGINGSYVERFGQVILSSNWLSESLTCTATSASQQLSFRLADTTKAYLSIDGIAVAAGGTTPAIPEPSTWGLMGLGLIGLAFAKRRTLG